MGITIRIGKDDEEQVTTNITVQGCSCRIEDFTMALVDWANQWVKDANRNAADKTSREQLREKALSNAKSGTRTVTVKPCGGCGDKKTPNAQ